MAEYARSGVVREPLQIDCDVDAQFTNQRGNCGVG